MALCERNLSTFYYCLYTGKTEITVDSEGTGEYKPTYATAVSCVGNIGGTSGKAQNNPFGILAEYDRTIMIAADSCPIKEDSVLFIDKAPEYESDGTPKFNYTVTGVGKNLGYYYILTKKV